MTKDTAFQQTMQASKWLTIQVLLDQDEMGALFEVMGNPLIYNVGQIAMPGQEVISKQAFLKSYTDYLSELKSGNTSKLAAFNPIFSSIFTACEDHVFTIPLKEGKLLARVCKPVVQLQPHSIGYSGIEQKFRPMIQGEESISWGIQLSYPQIFLDPITHDVEKVKIDPKFPNTNLFHKVRKWMRSMTLPTSFLVNDQKVTVPMRLGRKCFSWINAHPQLVKKGISVYVS